MVEDKKYKLLFNLNADDLFQFELHSFSTFVFISIDKEFCECSKFDLFNTQEVVEGLLGNHLLSQH